MLKSHLDAVEKHLLAISQVPANAGHTLHRGTPRETFVREFLVGHLSARLAVGTGEIIDAHSEPRQSRNQFDIIVYKADYPRIDLGGGMNAFLAESVVATIEVKSILTESESDRAIGNAAKAKKLERNLVSSFSSGYIPPGILSYVIAYDGPVNADTVHGWIVKSEIARGLNRKVLPATQSERTRVLSEGLEGVFCLGKHSVVFDNAPISPLTDEQRGQDPQAKRILTESADGNLFWFFLLLTQAAANMRAEWPNLLAYVQRVQVTSMLRA